MIRVILYITALFAFSSIFYLFFNDMGNVDIYFSGYQITMSAGVLCIVLILSFFALSGIIWLLVWIKNIPYSLMKMRAEHNHKRALNEVFDIVCAFECQDYELALRLCNRNNYMAINHPITKLLSFKASLQNKNNSESDLEKRLLDMLESEKVMPLAVKELVKQKVKSGEFELANEYITKLEKLSYKPSWYSRAKFSICLALEEWEVAVNVIEKAVKNKESIEASELISLAYFMQAKSYIKQNLEAKAISILKKNSNHIDSVLLLADLLWNAGEVKDAVSYLTKFWKNKQDYRLLKSFMTIRAELTPSKLFEEIETKFSPPSILFSQSAIELNLHSKAKKYLSLGDGSNHAKKLELLYKVSVDDDKGLLCKNLDRLLQG